MSSTDPADLPVVDPAAPPCRHLRNKGMYVYTDGATRASHPGYDNAIHWCLRTMKDIGPDDGLVGRDDCRNAERPCYEPT
jgi:hypothetical protein